MVMFFSEHIFHRELRPLKNISRASGGQFIHGRTQIVDLSCLGLASMSGQFPSICFIVETVAGYKKNEMLIFHRELQVINRELVPQKVRNLYIVLVVSSRGAPNSKHIPYRFPEQWISDWES